MSSNCKADTEQRPPAKSIESHQHHLDAEVEQRRSVFTLTAIRSSNFRFIFKVPSHVRRADENGYTPNVASIGPIHYKRNESAPMEAHKLRFLNRLLERNPKISQQHLIDAMKELEVRTRKCYFDAFENISSNDFVRMMVLDGCFILELLRLCSQGNDDDMNEPIVATEWMLPNLQRDLLLVENQLPLFVLHKLFELTSNNGDQGGVGGAVLFNMQALKFFKPIRPGRGSTPIEKMKLGGYHQHLLALFHSSFLFTANSSTSSSSRLRPRPSNNHIRRKGWVNNAQKLQKLGVSFKRKAGGRLLDLEFCSRAQIIKMPSIFFDDNIGPLLRNLVAYEQSNRCAPRYFTFVAVFFGSLIDTVEDVKILNRVGIVLQALGREDEVVRLFNSLPKELACDPNDYEMSRHIEDMNRYCQSLYARTRLQFFSMLGTKFFEKILLAYISVIVTIEATESYNNPTTKLSLSSIASSLFPNS